MLKSQKIRVTINRTLKNEDKTMKISTKGRYALRIMLDLAVNGKDGLVPLKDVAIRQGITLKYMEQIILPLSRAGCLVSHRGQTGGYRLAYDPSEYRVGDILRAVEGPLAPTACLAAEQNDCPRADVCPTLDFWKGLDNAVNSYVDSFTLADLLPPENADPTKMNEDKSL